MTIVLKYHVIYLNVAKGVDFKSFHYKKKNVNTLGC